MNYESLHDKYDSLILETGALYELFVTHKAILKGELNAGTHKNPLAAEYKNNNDEISLLGEGKRLARKICYVNKQFRENNEEQILLRKYDVFKIPAPGSVAWVTFTNDIYEVVDIFGLFYKKYREWLWENNLKNKTPQTQESKPLIKK